MAFLDAAGRAALRKDLKGMKFNRAKFKLLRLDRQGRLLYYRNAQQSGEWHSKFLLEGLGVAVTLVEVNHARNDQPRNPQVFEFVDILIEPTAANRR